MAEFEHGAVQFMRPCVAPGAKEFPNVNCISQRIAGRDREAQVAVDSVAIAAKNKGSRPLLKALGS
jgi:hypothetical protein